MHLPVDPRRPARGFCSAPKICIITARAKRYFRLLELLQEGTPRMQYSAIVFDLDGTLLDTLADIAEAANRVLVQHGFPAHEQDSYRQFVGDGVQVLFERSLPRAACTAERVAACADDFRQAYAECWHIRTHPYDGIEALLSTLVTRNVRLAVLSNKPDNFTKACVREFFRECPFEAVLGQRDGVPRKPDAAGALEIAAVMDLAPDQFLYAGDTAVDMQTAISAGMFPVGVLWGFRPLPELLAGGARAVIERPAELLRWFPQD
jgi:phosphoglycolate phosphatase